MDQLATERSRIQPECIFATLLQERLFARYRVLRAWRAQEIVETAERLGEPSPCGCPACGKLPFEIHSSQRKSRRALKSRNRSRPSPPEDLRATEPYLDPRSAAATPVPGSARPSSKPDKHSRNRAPLITSGHTADATGRPAS